MKIISCILLILLTECIQFGSFFKYSFKKLPPYNSPVQYAMLKDISLDGISDETNMLFADHIDRKMAYFLAMSATGPDDDDVSFNLDIIENVLNNNYDNMKKLKKAIAEELPQIKDVFKVSRRGFTCDQSFCDKFGEGHHAIGICTPHSCLCSAFSAEGIKCKRGLYYNPVYGICDIPFKIKICGL